MRIPRLEQKEIWLAKGEWQGDDKIHWQDVNWVGSNSIKMKKIQQLQNCNIDQHSVKN